MKRFDKKGVAGVLVDFFAYIFFALVIIIFYLLFHMGRGQIEQNINSEFLDSRSHISLMNYLATPLANNNVADLIIEYCTKEPADGTIKLNLYLKAQEVLDTSTTTARIVCSKNKIIDLRLLICKQPRNITIPTYQGVVKIEYCPMVDSAQAAVHMSVAPIITSPDGKKWHRYTFEKTDYYLEDNTENLITANDYDKRYINYKSSDEYNKKVDDFKKNVESGKSPVTSPQGDVWIKIGGNLWGLRQRGEVMYGAEATMLTKEKLIETLGDVPVGTRIIK
jgi:hypothetical protein